MKNPKLMPLAELMKIKDGIVEIIDRNSEPTKMNPGTALEFLEQLSTDIQCRIDGIKDDMRAKGQDWGDE